MNHIFEKHENCSINHQAGKSIAVDIILMLCPAVYASQINSTVVLCLKMNEANPKQSVNIDRKRLVRFFSLAMVAAGLVNLLQIYGTQGAVTKAFPTNH